MEKEMPFSGHKILITRSEEQALPLIRTIEEYGGEAVVIPLLSFQSPSDLTTIRSAIHEIQNYDWIVFTSQNTVRFFIKHMNKEGYSVEKLTNHKIAAIGKKTVEILEHFGLKTDFLPSRFIAEQFAEEFINYTNKGDRILFPKGNLARSIIDDELTKAGRSVSSITFYETIPDAVNREKLLDELKREDIDILTFTSSSSVQFFFQLLDQEISIENRICACIGPVTAATLEEYGVTADIIAEEYTIDGLIRSIGSYLEKEEG